MPKIFLVLLAPYGLNAQLTGHSLGESDTSSLKILEEWQRFFPSIPTLSTSGQPNVVEVLLADVKMLYPAKLVLIPTTPVTGLSYISNFQIYRKYCYEEPYSLSLFTF